MINRRQFLQALGLAPLAAKLFPELLSAEPLPIADLSSFAPPADYHAYIAGIRRTGPMTFKMNFAEDQISPLLNMLNDYEPKAMEVTLEDGTCFKSQGFVHSVEIAAPVDTFRTANVTFQPTGPVDISVAKTPLVAGETPAKAICATVKIGDVENDLFEVVGPTITRETFDVTTHGGPAVPGPASCVDHDDFWEDDEHED